MWLCGREVITDTMGVKEKTTRSSHVDLKREIHMFYTYTCTHTHHKICIRDGKRLENQIHYILRVYHRAIRTLEIAKNHSAPHKGVSK